MSSEWKRIRMVSSIGARNNNVDLRNVTAVVEVYFIFYNTS